MQEGLSYQQRYSRLDSRTEERQPGQCHQHYPCQKQLANRQATVVHAMQDAKKVAEGITQYVDAIRLMRAINMEE